MTELYSKESSSDEDDLTDLERSMLSELQTRKLLALAPTYLRKKILAHHAACKLRQLADRKKFDQVNRRDDGELTYEEIYSVVGASGKRFKKDSRIWLHKSWRKENSSKLSRNASNKHEPHIDSKDMSEAENLNLSCCTEHTRGGSGVEKDMSVTMCEDPNAFQYESESLDLSDTNEHIQRPSTPPRHPDELVSVNLKRRNASPCDSCSFFEGIDSDEEVKQLFVDDRHSLESIESDNILNQPRSEYLDSDPRIRKRNKPSKGADWHYVSRGWELYEDPNSNSKDSIENVRIVSDDEGLQRPLCTSPTCSICQEYSQWCCQTPPATPPCSPWGQIAQSISEEESIGFEVTKSSSSLCLVESKSSLETD